MLEIAGLAAGTRITESANCVPESPRIEAGVSQQCREHDDGAAQRADPGAWRCGAQLSSINNPELARSPHLVEYVIPGG